MSYLINTNVPVGSALNRLGSLIDVEINNPLGKDVLSYDSATQTWVNDDSIGNIVSMTQEQYDQLSTAEKQDPKKYYYITDATISGAPIDDDAVSTSKTWSSDKINSKLPNYGYDNYITNLTLPFTATKNCLMCLSFKPTAAGSVSFSVNGNEVYNYSNDGQSWEVCLIPLKIGDILSSTTTFTGIRYSSFSL
jgi:hypothetical protein